MTDAGEWPTDPVEMGTDAIPNGGKRLEGGDVSGGDGFVTQAPEGARESRQREGCTRHAMDQEDSQECAPLAGELMGA